MLTAHVSLAAADDGLLPKPFARVHGKRATPSTGDARHRCMCRSGSGKAEPAAMFLNILVAIDRSPSSRRALDEAIDLAHAMNSKLTLITVAPPISHYVPLAGVSGETMRKELDRWAQDVLDEAAAAIPDDVIAHRVQPTGHAGPRILEEIERGHHDLVVLGSRGRGRAQEGLLGSVNGYLHFHSRVPLLSVPAEGTAGSS